MNKSPKGPGGQGYEADGGPKFVMGMLVVWLMAAGLAQLAIPDGHPPLSVMILLLGALFVVPAVFIGIGSTIEHDRRAANKARREREATSDPSKQ